MASLVCAPISQEKSKALLSGVTCPAMAHCGQKSSNVPRCHGTPRTECSNFLLSSSADPQTVSQGLNASDGFHFRCEWLQRCWSEKSSISWRRVLESRGKRGTAREDSRYGFLHLSALHWCMDNSHANPARKARNQL